MESSLFSSEDSILFVGEGNFSFSLSFIKLNHYIKNITVSCFEKEIKCETTLKTISELESAGAEVILGIDATKLTSYTKLVDKKLTCIIFNFPHVGGKMKIDKNRRLLQDFFASCTSIFTLSKEMKECPHRILVSLCKGQGGTPADGDCLRVWGDTWQVAEMAALSGLVLKQVLPFNHDLCPGYTSVGYRSKDMWFHTDKALVHIFQPSAPLLVVPRISDRESLVSVETSAGLLGCERIYVEMAGFTEVQSERFLQIPRENSLEYSLFKSLQKQVEKMFENVDLIPSTDLPLHCNFSDSDVLCVLNNGNISSLRGNLLEVMDCFDQENCLTHGPVFQSVDEDFSVPPSRQQAVIRSSDVHKLLDVVVDWCSEQLFSSDTKIEHENLWTLYCSNQIIAQKIGRHLIIELSLIACIKYKIHGFRDLLNAKTSEKMPCVLASLFPRTHQLDVCFIEGPQFSEKRLWLVLWRSLGHWLVDVKIFDLYEPAHEDWVSRGYHLNYRSSSKALSRSAAVTLHQNILPDILMSSKVALRIL